MPPQTIDSVGPFRMHPGHRFDGFDILDRGGSSDIIVARCECGAIFDVADAAYSPCPECDGRGESTRRPGRCLRCEGGGRVVDHAGLRWRLPTQREEQDARSAS